MHLAAGIHAARALDKPTAGISLAVSRTGATPHVLRSFGLLFQAPAPALSGNPVFEGWYADPEAHSSRTYWIYPTYSAPYDKQMFFDASRHAIS